MAAAEEISQDTAIWPRLYEDKRYRHGFLGTLSDFQEAGVLQDVVLEVESRRFPCHRLVLSAASPYFRAMFTSDMAESRQKAVALQGLDPDMLEEILSYIYSGTLHVSMDTVQPLYQAADLLQVDYVRETCTSYMAMNVEHSTCLDLYTFADAFYVRKLKDRCQDHICRNFEKVSTSADFCSLSVDHLTEIISHDGLDVKEETTVWEAVVRWVEYSWEDRQHHLPSILPHIRFNLMSSDDMAAILEHPLVRDGPGTSEAIRNVVQRGFSNIKLRAGMDRQEMALLFSTITKEMLCMNPRTGKSIQCPVIGDLDLNTDDIIATTVTSNNDIYLLTRKSSHPRDGQLSLVMYSHVRNVWEQQSSVCRVAGDGIPNEEYLVEAGGHLYYLAFFNLQISNTYVRIRRYDQHTDQWPECSRPQFKEGTADVGKAVSCGQHLYIFTESEMHRYHPCKDQWCIIATPNNYPNYIEMVVATTTEIFCESYKLGEMYLYDTLSDSWKKLPDWNLSGSYNNFVIDYCMYFVLEGRLHMFTAYTTFVPWVGLDSPISYAWQVCVLDRSKGTWTDLKAPLPSGRWLFPPNVLPVARMYLPCLTANGTDVQRTADL